MSSGREWSQSNTIEDSATRGWKLDYGDESTICDPSRPLGNFLTCVFVLVGIISVKLISNHCFYNLRPTLQSGKGVNSTLSGCYPLTHPAWVALTGAQAPVSIAALFITIKWWSIGPR